MTIKKTLAIARWEFIEKVRTKAFIISLIITPLFIILVSVVPTLLMSKGDSSTVDIGLIDYTGEITQRLNEDLLEKYKLPDGKPNYEIVSIPADDSARAIGNRLVLDGKISSYVVVDTSIRSTRTFGYVSQNVSNFNQLERIRSSMKDIIVSSELEQSGVGTGIIKEITKPVNYETVQLSKTGQEEKAQVGSGLALGYMFIMVLALFILTSGQLLVRSVVEEKSNRIVEVLLSSATPDEIMTGKILGLSLLGLTQLAIWAAIGIAFAGQLATFITVPDNIWWVFVFFALGFLFYASIFVMAGAPVTTEQEAQQATSYVSMILFLPIVLAFVVAQNPTAPYLKIISLIPLLTPTMMAFRIPIQSPDLWELLLSTAILLASTYFCMIAAGRIFRIGILVYGKRPTFKELARWAFKKG